MPYGTLFALRPEQISAELAPALEAFGRKDFSSAQSLLEGWLRAGPAHPQRPAYLARAAFEHLLLVIGQLGDYAGVEAALRAPWSPARDECSEAHDRRYVRAIKATGAPPLPLARRSRFFELGQLFSQTRCVEGDVAECGSALGISSHFICQILAAERPGFDGAGYHVFDSFAGLSEPAAEDAIPDNHPDAQRLRDMCRAGMFAVPLARVQRNLAEFPAITFHPGWIPETFHELPETRYRFVHLDVDLYDPTFDGLEYFYPRLASGGMIVSDDYAWPGARLAFEDFRAVSGAAMETTPLDQAIVRKP
jgi:O-methyltransferase